MGLQGNALIWIPDFLKNKKIKLCFNGVLHEIKTRNGISKSSVLSPLMLLIYFNNIHPYLHKEMKVNSYIDDASIWHSDENLNILSTNHSRESQSGQTP